MKNIIFSFTIWCALLTNGVARTAPECNESHKSGAAFTALILTSVDIASVLFVAPCAFNEMKDYVLLATKQPALSCGLGIAAGVVAAAGCSEAFRHLILGISTMGNVRDSVSQINVNNAFIREVKRLNSRQRDFAVNYALLGCIGAALYTLFTL